MGHNFSVKFYGVSVLMLVCCASLCAQPDLTTQTWSGRRVYPVKSSRIDVGELIASEKNRPAKPLAAPAPAVVPWLPVAQDMPAPPSGKGTPAQAPAPSAAAGNEPLSPPVINGFEALGDNGTFIPPDTNGAVGPNHLMVALNSQIRFQTKTGTNLSTISPASFWSSLGTIGIFDPKTIYDPQSGRFIFVSCTQIRSASSGMLLAVSATSDPTGTWNMWLLDGDAANVNWVDYPNIGVNGKWITFTSNMFAISNNAFAGVNVWVVDKSTALSGGPLTSTLFFRTGLGSALVPCLTFSAAEPTQYLVSTWSSSSGLLRLFTIAGPAAAPVFTATALYPSSSAWNSVFPGAPQLGSVNTIDTNDWRMMNAVLRNGSLWCAHAVALPEFSPNRIAVKWWEVNPATGATIQSGVVDDPAPGGMFYFFPTLAVNAANEVLLGFSGSSPATYCGAYYAYRNAASPAGTMSAVMTLKAGEQPYYKIYGGSRNRWGDYSATCVDPADDLTLWTLQQYAASPANIWGTWWGMLNPAPTIKRIVRAEASPTSATSVAFKVGFSEAVSGVDSGDFDLWTSGTLGGAAVTAALDGPTTWTVTVNTGTGDGELRLDLKASGTGIINGAGDGLAGGFTAGEIYRIDRTAPAFTGLTASPDPAALGTLVTLAVTASETLAGSPTATVNGHAAVPPARNGDHYTFNYTIQAADPDGGALVAVTGRDRAGNTGTRNAPGAFIVDKTPPAGTVAINNNAEYTSSAEVMLNLAAGDTGSGVEGLRLSNETEPWSPWEDYTPLRLWTLTGGDGIKTVNVQYRDRAGNESAATSDTIELDTRPLAYRAEWQPAVGEYRFFYNSAHFMTWVTRDANGNILDLRPHPDGGPNDNAWGSSWYMQPFISGAILKHTDVLAPLISRDGITLNVSGRVSRDADLTYGGWHFSMKFAYDPALRKIQSTTGTYAIVLDGVLAATGRDLNLFKVASNYLVNVPVVTGGLGQTGDMRWVDVLFAGLFHQRWIPSSGSTYPSDPTANLTLDVAGDYNRIYWPGIALAPKPGLKIRIARVHPGAPLTFGAGYDEAQKQNPYADNVGLTPLIRNGASDTTFNFNVWFESTPTTTSIAQRGTLNIHPNLSQATWRLTGPEGIDVQDGGTKTLLGAPVGQYQAAWNPVAGWTAPTTTTMTLHADESTTIAGVYRDFAPPQGGILIESGLAMTSSPQVSLALTATDMGSGVAEMRLVNENGAWPSWTPFAGAISWTLGPGDGMKTVRAQFRDVAGNASAGTSDTIALDTAAPQSQVTAPAGTTTDPALTVRWTAADPGPAPAGIRIVRVYWSRPPGPWNLLGTYGSIVNGAAFNANGRGGPGTYRFYCVATDRLGNVESPPAAPDATVTLNAPSIAKNAKVWIKLE